MNKIPIGFIGVGNMGGAILKGIIRALDSERNPGSLNFISKEEIYITSKTKEKREKIAAKLGVKSLESAYLVAKSSKLIFLGTKPDTFPEVLDNIRGGLSDNSVLISMAAGMSIAKIRKLSKQGHIKVVRIMPNTPALIGCGATAICASENVNAEEIQQVKTILSCVGRVASVSEELFHAVIGISGSSPAYTYMYIEGLIKAGIKRGLPEKEARILAGQSVLGAAAMVLAGTDELKDLIERVCSKGGTTIEAVKKLEDLQFENIVDQAFESAYDKSIKMTSE